MRVNIEWMAPWRHGGPWKAYSFHWINTSSGTRGVWVLGLCVTFTGSATTHGIGIGLML